MTFVFAILFEFFTPKKAAARCRPFLVLRRDLIIVRLIQLFISKTYHKFFNVAICLAQNDKKLAKRRADKEQFVLL